MQKPLFIAIGVHKAYGLDTLDGVLPSVADMVQWAGSRAYDPVVITDDPALPGAERDVTVDRIRAALPAEVLLDRPRIVVYFCGHGLYAPGDQHWVLSAGPNNRRISAFGFHQALETYGPKQIAVFSDACSLPWVQNATADQVIDNYVGDAADAQKDLFYSTREGAPSFAVPAKDGEPAYCVFSRTLSRVLSATAPAPLALDQLYLQTGKRAISSQSLASYLEAEVPAVALASGKKQRPSCNPGFRPLDNIYVEFAAHTPPTEPPPGEALNLDDIVLHAYRLHGESNDPSDFEITGTEIEIDSPPPDTQGVDFDTFRADRRELSRSEWRGPLVEQAAQVIFSLPRRDDLLLIDRGADLPEPTIDESLLIAAVNDRQTVHRLSDSQTHPVVVQCGDFFAPVVPYRGLWCVMAFRTDIDATDRAKAVRGADLMCWGSVKYPEGPRYRSSVEALKGLNNGILTADDIGRLAHALRDGKHADPMLGVVAAYLYAQIGDIDSIRRMAFFYRAHHQAVPFDIALLSKLPLHRSRHGFLIEVPAVSETPARFRAPEAPGFTWQATEATSVDVAGLTPFLPAGWQLLSRSEHAVHRRCAELMSHLSNSTIATVDGQDAGQALRQAFLEFHKDPP